MAKICAAIICGQTAEPTIEACIRSIRPGIDHLSITYTIVTENTQNKVRDIIKAVCEELNLPYTFSEWTDHDAIARGLTYIVDFAGARNFNFANIPPDCDWSIWVDSDDTLEGVEYLHEIADNIEPDMGAVWFPYDYSKDEFGNCTTLYERERLVRMNLGWVWRGRLHETVSSINPCRMCRSDKVIWRHNHLGGPSRHDRNMTILNIMMKENPEDKRVWMYLGHQYFAHQDWLDAADWYLKYASCPDIVPLEKYQCLCYCAKALRECKDFNQSAQIALMAVELYPNFIDGYLELAHAYNAMNNPDKTLHWLQLSENKELIQSPPALIFLNPLDTTYNKYCLYAESWMKKGDVDKAIYWLGQAANVRPAPEVKQRLKELIEAKNRSNILDGMKMLCVDLLNKGEIAKLTHVVEAAPFWLRELPDYQQMVSSVEHYKKMLGNSKENIPVPDQELRWNAVLESLEDNKGSILQVDCGDGTLVRLLDEVKLNVHGIDADQDNIRVAEQILPGKFKVNSLDGQKKKYDTVLSVNRIEYEDSIEKYLEKLDKVAPHVLVTTAVPKVNSTEGKIRARVINQYDLSRAIMSKKGRRIVNLHKLSSPDCDEDIILCEYDNQLLDNKYVKVFLGQGPEYWSPLTIRNVGCGGSETSAAWLSRSLAKTRCLPIIYSEDNQVWDGVLYRQWQNFSNEGCNLFISSRVPEIYDQDIQAEQKWLWLHDVDCGPRLKPQHTDQIDVLWVLSHWHANHIKRTYPWLKDAVVLDPLHREATFEDDTDYQQRVYEGEGLSIPRIMVLGDGIDTGNFKNKWGEKRPFSFIWSSAPDRGLEELLNFWPRIKEVLPEATLNIYYGWEYFDRSLFIPEQRTLKARLKKLLEQTQNMGVRWVGRVGQLELADIMRETDAWIYPPHGFRETCCISAIEYQASGVICFYRENGALGETIGDRGIPITNDNLLEKIAILKDRDACEKIRERGREWAMGQDWDIIAEKMLEVYNKIEKKELASV